jgi:hypothetical protein
MLSGLEAAPPGGWAGEQWGWDERISGQRTKCPTVMTWSTLAQNSGKFTKPVKTSVREAPAARKVVQAWISAARTLRQRMQL